MSLSDTAEYWRDVKSPRPSKRIFVHAAGCECGHYHLADSKKLFEVDCHACKRIIEEMGNIFNLDIRTNNEIKEERKAELKKTECNKCGGQMVKRRNKKYNSAFLGCTNYPRCRHTISLPIEIGEIVSHDDYSTELFTVTDIEDGVVWTAGGKNGTWANPIDLIIRNPKI